jgi:hypothetical protein
VLGLCTSTCVHGRERAKPDAVNPSQKGSSRTKGEGQRKTEEGRRKKKEERRKKKEERRKKKEEKKTAPKEIAIWSPLLACAATQKKDCSAVNYY